jgi:hypothetical protein
MQMADDTSAPSTPAPSKSALPERLVAFALVLYLMVVGLGSSKCLFETFPTSQVKPGELATTPVTCTVASVTVFTTTNDRVLLFAAMLAGIVGSFLHAAQSLATYVGNDDFKMSWTAWYLLRPWIGGILGFALYFIARAGLVGGLTSGDTDSVNPYGVVGIGLLGGWFSKTTTDKLQEVFSTLFKTDEDKKRKDKLTPDVQPAITGVKPNPVPASATEIAVSGTGFLDGATASIGQQTLETTFVSEKALTVSLSKLTKRPAGEGTLVVKNTSGGKPETAPFTITFEP